MKEDSQAYKTGSVWHSCSLWKWQCLSDGTIIRMCRDGPVCTGDRLIPLGRKARREKFSFRGAPV